MEIQCKNMCFGCTITSKLKINMFIEIFSSLHCPLQKNHFKKLIILNFLFFLLILSHCVQIQILGLLSSLQTQFGTPKFDVLAPTLFDHRKAQSHPFSLLGWEKTLFSFQNKQFLTHVLIIDASRRASNQKIGLSHSCVPSMYIYYTQ